MRSREDLTAYTPPDPAAEGRLNDIITAVAMNRDLGEEAVAILGGVNGPLTLAWMLVGYENICMKLFDDQAFLKQVARLAADFGVIAIDRMAAAGVDAMIVSEDLGSSSGGLLSPKHFNDVFKPALGTLIQRAEERGLPTIVHSCGRIYEYLNDLVDLEMTALHALQRTAGMDLAQVKTRYGDHICLIGNIDSSRTLPYGTPEEIRQEVKDAIQAAAPGFGYILGSDHSLHDGISVEAMQTMFDAAREYGTYPVSVQA